jgi:hypothetical protein
MAGAVEAKAIDEGAVRFQPEEARLGVARLRQRSDAAHFDKAKAKPQQCIGRFDVFIETCCDAQGVGKHQTVQIDLQRRLKGLGCDRTKAGLQSRYGEAVGSFGRGAKQQWPQ